MLMDEDWTIEELFAASPDPREIAYRGQVVVRSDQFPTNGATDLKITFESVSGDWPQAVYLSSQGVMEINNHSGQAFVLWEETSPHEIALRCDPAMEHVRVSNAWDPDGSGYPERWLACGAMKREDIPQGRRYRCNDGYPDQDFDDLVFRLERVE